MNYRGNDILRTKNTAVPYLTPSFAKRKIIVNRTKFWFILIAVLVFLILDLILIIGEILRKWNSIPIIRLLTFLPVLIPIILFVYWIFNKIFSRLDKKMDEYVYNIDIASKGDEGENIACEELKDVLGDNYKILRNTVLPGRKSDIDIIIVGPRGVCVLEIKNYDTNTIFTHDVAYYKDKMGNPVPLKKDYREVVKWQADGLKYFLAENGLTNIFIHKALVYLNPESIEIRDEAKNKYGVYVAVGVNGLKKFIESVYIDTKFDTEFCFKICEALRVLGK